MRTTLNGARKRVAEWGGERSENHWMDTILSDWKLNRDIATLILANEPKLSAYFSEKAFRKKYILDHPDLEFQISESPRGGMSIKFDDADEILIKLSMPAIPRR